jgi:hypothetical protein
MPRCEDVNELESGVFPSLQRRGGRAIKKMVPFRKGADGVVVRESRFGMHFEALTCERPPRLRRFGGFTTFY